MNVIAMHHPGIGCSYHRVYLPCNHLVSTKVNLWSGPTTPPDSILEWANVVWFNRVPTCSFDSLLRKREEIGFKIVVDVDDHWILYPHHEMASAWATSETHKQIQECIIHADGVTVTNSRLCEAVQSLNKKVWIVANALPYDRDQFSPGKEASDKVRFIYAGGSSHYHDLKTISSVFQKLGKDPEFRAKGQIILAGYQNSFGTGRIDNVWEKMLRLVKPAVNYETYPMRPLERYMDCYRYADVALAPLESSTFNAHKSNLKILEAGAKRIPIIASNVEPYSKFDSTGVHLCNTPKEWFDAIKLLLQSTGLRTQEGWLLGDRVRAYYDLGTLNELRERIFLRVCQ